MKQQFLKVAVAIAAFLLFYYCILTYQFYPVLRANLPAGYSKLPVFLEVFWIPIASALILNLVKRSIVQIASPMWAPFCKNQDDPELLEKRIYKCSYNTYKTVFYTIGTIWGYQLCKNSSVWPTIFGGHNAWGPELWDSYPI